jgi:hypothetical protein
MQLLICKKTLVEKGIRGSWNYAPRTLISISKSLRKSRKTFRNEKDVCGELFPGYPELLLVADFLVEDVVLLWHELLVDLPLQVRRRVGRLGGAVQLQQVTHLQRKNIHIFGELQ